MKHKGARSDVNRLVSTSYDDDGFLEGQLEPEGAQAGGTALPTDLYHPFGFQGRPNDADQDTSGNLTDGALALQLTEGNGQAAVACDDGRVSLPQLGKGGSRQYDASGARCELDGQGNLTVTVPKGTNKIIFTGPGAGGIQLGGQTALALGPALQQLLAAMQAFVLGNVTAVGSPLSTSAAAVTALQAIQNVQTQILEGG